MPRAGYLLIALSFFGAVISFHLYDVHLDVHAGHGAAAGFCTLTETFQCETAAQSEWSTVVGIPVAAWGLGYYLGLIALAACIPWVSERSRRHVLTLILALVSLSVLYSLFLFAVSVGILKTVCPFCFVLYAINGLSFLCLPWLVTGQVVKESPMRIWKAIQSMPSLLFAGVVTTTVLSLLTYKNETLYGENGQDALALLEQQWDETQAEPRGKYPTSDDLSKDIATPYFMGNPDAKLKIVVFSDYGCGFCRRTHETFHELLAEYPSEIVIEWRHFPLDASCNPLMNPNIPGHPHACLAARLNIAAQKDGKAIELARLFYDIQQIPAKERTEELYLEASKELGLDIAALKKCAETGPCYQRLESDIQYGIEKQIRTTPTILIGERKIQGFPGRIILKQEIDKALGL